MNPSLSLSPAFIAALFERIEPAPPSGRAAPLPRPLHVLYGGAHLFTRETPAKLGVRALAAFDAHSAGLSNDDELLRRVREKVARQAVDALCIDFEDGYGPRPDAEEDADAVRAGQELAATPAGPVIGIRIKALAGLTLARAVRTLDLFITAAAKEAVLRPGFTVTLPKVTRSAEVDALCQLLEALERHHGLEPIAIELMIETAAALRVPRELVEAGGGRVTAVHLGAYDLLSELGVGPRDQSLAHPFCDHARMRLRLQLEDLGISDGATTTLPTSKDPEEVHFALRLHMANIRHAILMGVHQGWDLHPAQLPARWTAVFASYREQHAELAARLATFLARGAQAARSGQVFDDAATAQGILAFFRRGLACGALDEADLAATTLTPADLERSFAKILATR